MLQEVCQQIYATLYDYPCLKACSGLLEYVSQCVRVAWGLCVQRLPYTISYESQTFDDGVHTRFHTSDADSEQIKSYLWPALVDAQGVCVSRAVVITWPFRLGEWHTCVRSCGDHTTHQGGGRGWSTCVQSCDDHTTHQGRGRGEAHVFRAVVITQHIRVGAPVFRAVVITQHIRVGAGVGHLCSELWWSHNTSGWGQGWGTCVWSCGDHTTLQGGGRGGEHVFGAVVITQHIRVGAPVFRAVVITQHFRVGAPVFRAVVITQHFRVGAPVFRAVVITQHIRVGAGAGAPVFRAVVIIQHFVVGAGDGACVFRAVVIAWHLGTGAHCTELWWSHDKSGWGLGAGHMHVLSCGDHKRVEGGGRGGGGHLHIQSSGDSMTCWGGGRGWGTYIYRAVMIAWHWGGGRGWGTYIYRAVVITWHVGVGAGGGAPTYTELWWSPGMLGWGWGECVYRVVVITYPSRDSCQKLWIPSKGHVFLELWWSHHMTLRTVCAVFPANEHVWRTVVIT